MIVDFGKEQERNYAPLIINGSSGTLVSTSLRA